MSEMRRSVKHQRIRTFNLNDGKEPGLNFDLCKVVRAGNHIFLQGQSAFTLDGEFVGVGDAAAQAENAMQCVKALLEEAGSDLSHICKITTFITDLSNRRAVYEVIGRHLKGVHPVSTGIVVQSLGRPEMLMEIDVFAVVPENDA